VLWRVCLLSSTLCVSTGELSWFPVACKLTFRVEANGKHYMAGGYPFAPLTFAVAEEEGDQ